MNKTKKHYVVFSIALISVCVLLCFLFTRFSFYKIIDLDTKKNSTFHLMLPVWVHVEDENQKVLFSKVQYYPNYFLSQPSLDYDSFVDYPSIPINTFQVKMKRNGNQWTVILWKDSLTKIKESVSDFYFTQDILDLKANEKGYIHFNLNAGSRFELDLGSPDDIINFNNIATFLTIHAYDKTGIDWGIVKSFENLPLGEYIFKWDGKSLEGNEFLPDGDFYLAAKIKGMVYDGNRNDVYETILSDIELTIEGSSVPAPPSFIITGPKKVNVGDKFVMNIGFREPLNLEEFSIELKFSRAKLEPLNMQLCSFVDQENLKKKDYEFEKGTFYIKGNRNPNWNGNGNAIIAQLEFEAKRKVDNLEIKVISYRFEDSNENERKTIFLFPDITIEKENTTLGDFNEDGLINDLDFERLVNHYGLCWKDEKWIPDFDLNSDYYVDIADLEIFSKFYSTQGNMGNSNRILYLSHT